MSVFEHDDTERLTSEYLSTACPPVTAHDARILIAMQDSLQKQDTRKTSASRAVGTLLNLTSSQTDLSVVKTALHDKEAILAPARGKDKAAIERGIALLEHFCADAGKFDNYFTSGLSLEMQHLRDTQIRLEQDAEEKRKAGKLNIGKMVATVTSFGRG